MNSALTRLAGLRRAAPAALLLSLLTACGGGGSDVGDQKDAKPVAVAQAIGSSSTVSGTVPARSGSDILLTGKESDGIDDPILRFQWRQIDNSGVNVELIERTRSTKLITVPQVAQATDLQFELTVIDSDNVSATDTVTVNAVPAPDANVFLEQDAAVDPGSNQYQLVVGVEPGETTNSNFSLDVETVVEWLDRTGSRQSLVLETRRIEGTWPDGVTGEDDIVSAAFNPRYLFSLPEVDMDEINKRFEGPGDRDLRIEQRDIDSAQVFMRFALDRFDNNARLVLLFNDGSTREIVTTALGETDSGPISGDELKTWAGQESGITAANYYALIEAPETLSEWLQASGFGDTPREQEGVAHAIYLNNFDLGFGRDMYLRVDEDCGNVYSYVGNYPSLDTALQNLNNFATVVMEYSPLDNGCGDDKIVKFLVYVPDETTGEQVLVNSMNFDGRGEKFVPGVCTVCHGGAANDLSGLDLDTIAALGDNERLALADLNASFMPWDLDSFLFADTDPAITADRAIISDADRERFSRNAQEEDFKAMNQGALHTYLGNPERFAPSIELVHGWYGREDCSSSEPDTQAQLTPGASFDGSFVQCGWRDEPQLYDDTFARYCRACHTQLDAIEFDETNFDTSAEFLDSAELDSTVFRKGTMPLARLTYDRFWTAFDGGTRAVDALGAARNVTPTDTGLPFPAISALPTIPDGGQVVVLDGSASAFADRFNWTIAADAGCAT
ncbi:MAG: hypothetical protein HKN19_12640, partial [Halioglobus sp.]|nr:hypothetical protein [Halioglobus sp.]